MTDSKAKTLRETRMALNGKETSKKPSSLRYINIALALLLVGAMYVIFTHEPVPTTCVAEGTRVQTPDGWVEVQGLTSERATRSAREILSPDPVNLPNG